MFKVFSKYFLIFLAVILLTKPTIAITGKDISEKVSEWLVSQGINGKPVFSKTSVYKDCKNKLEIEKLYKNYKTVKVNCSDQNGYQLLIRVKILNKKHKSKILLKTKINEKLISKKKKVIIETNRNFKVLRLTRSLEKNAIIKMQDIELVKSSNSSQKSFFFS